MTDNKADRMKDHAFQRVIQTFLNTPPKPKQDGPPKRAESKAAKPKKAKPAK